jgi:hypothetical protein
VVPVAGSNLQALRIALTKQLGVQSAPPLRALQGVITVNKWEFEVGDDQVGDDTTIVIEPLTPVRIQEQHDLSQDPGSYPELFVYTHVRCLSDGPSSSEKSGGQRWLEVFERARSNSRLINADVLP